jgi:hypothetical protein
MWAWPWASKCVSGEVLDGDAAPVGGVVVVMAGREPLGWSLIIKDMFTTAVTQADTTLLTPPGGAPAPLPQAHFWKDRLKAAGVHLALSLAVAALAAGLVFAVWYPYPYREISGGRELFFLVVAVDVVLGPLLTLTVFNRTKPRRELRRDLAVIGALQLAALVYGMWTVAVARPVHLVFEIDRFRVVHVVDIPQELLKRAPLGLQKLPLWGPTTVALRPFKDQNESMEATMMALGGVQLGARPDLWQPYAQSTADVIKAARPLADLKTRFATRAAEIDAALPAGTRKVGYVPMAARDHFWTVLVDLNTAEVLGFVPIDSF